LTKVDIQKYIAEQQEKLQDKLDISKETVINELAKIAFSDIRKIFNTNDSLKNIQELDDNTSGAIASIKIKETTDTGTACKTVEIKFYDKVRALIDLGKHLGLFREKIEVEHSLSLTLQEYFIN
jgi:phage terminase small subunit